jgi:hypothetical protein
MSAEKSEDSDSSGIVSFLNRWINDILGLVFPGYLLMLLLILVFHGFDLMKDIIANIQPQWFIPALSVGLAYFFGNFLTAFGERFVFRPIGCVCSYVRNHSSRAPSWVKTAGEILVPVNVASEEALARSIGMRSDFQAFQNVAKERHGVGISDPPAVQDVRMLRSIAISATPEISQLTTKFTFLAILNGNIATVALLLAVALLSYGKLWSIGIGMTFSARLVGVLICGVFFYVHTLTRYEHFRRSMTTPFSGAVGRNRSQHAGTSAQPATATRAASAPDRPEAAGP